MSYITPAQFRSGLQEAKDYADSVAGSGGSGSGSSSVGSGIQMTYIVGNTPFADDWLSLSDGGEALTPENNGVYAVMTDGDYCRCMYLWNGTEYTPVGDKYNLYSYDDIVHNLPDVSTGSGDRSELYRITPREHTITVRLELDYARHSSYGGGFKYGFENSLKTVDTGGGHRVFDVSVTQENIGEDFIIKSDNGSFCTLTITNCTITEISSSYHTTEYIGAKTTADGKSGLVPPATSSEKDFILFGDGKWKDPNTSFSIQDMVNDATSHMQGEINGFQLNIARNGVVGEITAWLGAEESAPQNYLVCKGQTLNRLDYPQLYNVLYTLPAETRALWGDADWIDTFNLPDLRGEFIRGAGTNSHADQGDGDSVGVHQDGTKHRDILIEKTSAYYINAWIDTQDNDQNPLRSDSKLFQARNVDTMTYPQQNTSSAYVKLTTKSSHQYADFYTSRPTNTSVLYIIRYKADEASITQYFAPLAYSTEEQRVGTWIDGKPLYRRVYSITTASNTSAKEVVGLSELNIEYFNVVGGCISSNTGAKYPIPFAYSGSETISVYMNKNKNLCVRTGDSAYCNLSGNVAIEYTKTTDTPTPSSDPNEP